MKLAEATGDMTGLSQSLIEEKNAEIDALSDQLAQLQADLADIKAERGVGDLVRARLHCGLVLKLVCQK